jgi:hypothetical protein
VTDDEKSPPKQTRLGWGTLKMVGWATRPQREIAQKQEKSFDYGLGL